MKRSTAWSSGTETARASSGTTVPAVSKPSSFARSTDTNTRRVLHYSVKPFFFLFFFFLFFSHPDFRCGSEGLLLLGPSFSRKKPAVAFLQNDCVPFFYVVHYYLWVSYVFIGIFLR